MWIEGLVWEREVLACPRHAFARGIWFQRSLTSGYLLGSLRDRAAVAIRQHLGAMAHSGADGDRVSDFSYLRPQPSTKTA